MTKKKNKALQYLRVRCSVFFSQDTGRDPMTWWNGVVREEPDERTSQPKLATELIRKEHFGGELQLSLQPLRADWNLLPIVNAVRTDPIPNLALADVEDFLKQLKPWLATLSSVSRLAFGATIIEPLASRDAAYKRLDELLPSVKVDTTARDLMYQINRRRKSETLGALQLNRVAKWAAAMFRPVTFQVSGVGAPRATVTADPAFAARVEVDINTDEEFQGELPVTKLPQLFSELVTLGDEIAREGDIP